MKGQKPLGVVIKLGTSSIVDETTHEPLLSNLALIVETAVKLRKDGHRVVIVSSGAIGVGLRRMDVDRRPKHLTQLQALAAIGQCRLMSLWDSLFEHMRQPIAQILLTRNDIADRTRYLNAQNTFNELLEMGVIPIVNENDTLAVSEIKFGDNDTLSAITAALIHADILFLMTDVDCLYDKNPRTNPDARPIEVVSDIASLQADVSSAGSSLGTGGMSTKITAARLATSAGVTTVITRASNPGNITKIVQHIQPILRASHSSHIATPSGISETDEATLNGSDDYIMRSTGSLRSVDTVSPPPLHTRFLPSPSPIRDRTFLILHGYKPRGTLYIDSGAYRALLKRAGLFPAGIVDVEGVFAQQEAVRIVVVDKSSIIHPTSSTPAQSRPLSTASIAGVSRPAVASIWHGEGIEVGRALVNYSSTEIARVKGHQSKEIEELLGYADSEYVAEREHISFFRRTESRPQTPSRDLESSPGKELLETPSKELGAMILGITAYESKASGALPDGGT